MSQTAAPITPSPTTPTAAPQPPPPHPPPPAGTQLRLGATRGDVTALAGTDRWRQPLGQLGLRGSGEVGQLERLALRIGQLRHRRPHLVAGTALPGLLLYGRRRVDALAH